MLGKVAIIGYSGHGLVVADAAIAASINLTHYCERNERDINPFECQYLGDEGQDGFLGWERGLKFILGIGDNIIRHKVASQVIDRREEILNVVHPSASISSIFKMGVGNFIGNNASVNILSEIGNFCILNTNCVIEHECKIGNAVHIAPGAVLAGNVSVGDLTFVGANTVVKQGIKIGRNVTIGAGSVIISDVADNVKIVGNPGRIL